MHLFRKKKWSVAIVAAAIVVVLLLCILLTFLTQLPSLRATKEKLERLAAQAKTDDAALRELIDYRKTDQYVIEWAINMGMIDSDVVEYIRNEVDGAGK